MPLYLKSQADILALVNGSAFPTVEIATREELAQHFILMPPAVREGALGILAASLPTDQAAFVNALFSGTPPPDGSASPANGLAVASTGIVANVAAVRALPTALMPMGAVYQAVRDDGQMGTWELRAGNDADAAPGIIRGNDFTVSAPRVWEEKL